MQASSISAGQPVSGGYQPSQMSAYGSSSMAAPAVGGGADQVAFGAGSAANGYPQAAAASTSPSPAQSSSSSKWLMIGMATLATIATISIIAAIVIHHRGQKAEKKITEALNKKTDELKKKVSESETAIAQAQAAATGKAAPKAVKPTEVKPAPRVFTAPRVATATAIVVAGGLAVYNREALVRTALPYLKPAGVKIAHVASATIVQAAPAFKSGYRWISKSSGVLYAAGVAHSAYNIVRRGGAAKVASHPLALPAK